MWEREIEIFVLCCLGGAMASAEAMFSRHSSSASPKVKKQVIPNGEEQQPSPIVVGRDAIMEDDMDKMKQVS